ncbi:DNA/RNA non-specific endonuclease [Leuconostoc citreum]|uniref:DNA/RNA non-specific endonuclease n=1 Tax=Leuconostoc citreum TaxID=33964 RepID=UPI001888937E|nr:DNA/RNA non-specific endonuclease [Leuconostoc citreum]MCT3054783.1 DNA-entry nuclease [Leuconostoc citreum]MCT3063268.1 DNA-entry nuclease [Leuconostoc citreum]QOY96890.1 DNA/RNA non-specific endonuclease [Leuconostoc citreum]
MKNYKRGRFARRILFGIVILIGIIYLNRVSILQTIVALGSQSQLINIDKQKSYSTQNDELANLKYNGQTVVEVNHNQPTFSQDDLQIKEGGWQKLSSLDWLGRPQVANALLNQKLMPPSQKYKARERLTIKTPGYHAIKTGTNTKDWFYNRSHLIGYQFTGLNNEAKNLITGTRQLNADSRANAKSMVTYETEIADYLNQSKNNYVRYQVKPIYKNVELVPRGVHMMAQSNDNTLKFNIYVFNVQDGWTINYLNGNAERSE